ncbi:MAG: 8-amino-7-oxononanoate synthase [Proteobacteria bacterium]|nr:8-amino-7-oxononanoate synthase [Pseudomonadota bacterium]
MLEILLKKRLDDRKSKVLYRVRHARFSPQKPEVVYQGRSLLSFSSNDYLGLANHPEVVSAFQRGAEKYGVGSGASSVISGYTSAHAALEEELSEFLGYPRVLLFSNGYMANLGVLKALLKKGDHLFQDKLNHASLIDGGLFSGAHFKRYLHNDLSSLKRELCRPGCESGHPEREQCHPSLCEGSRLIVSDGVFSMDGDLAHIPDLSRLARQYAATLMIDDAHGMGVLGATGRGSLEHHGLKVGDVDILTASFGKSFGASGAFVAANEMIIESCIQFARTYTYHTNFPAAIAEACRVSLQLIQKESWRREKLQKLVHLFKKGAKELGLKLSPSDTPIQPLMIGDEATALAVSDSLYQKGILALALRAPSVPKGSARLRITFSAEHTEEQVQQLLHALEMVNHEKIIAR